MSIHQEKILQLLKQIKHPALGKDIVELGLVQELSIEDKLVKFKLIFEKPNDPLKSAIKKACYQVIKKEVELDVQVQIELEAEKTPPKKPADENTLLSQVKNIVAVASGKGGVGKSTIAVNLAVALAKKGFKTGIIDADIYGPSIPKMLNAEKERPFARKIDNKDVIIPVERHGLKILSIGFFIDPADATIWRGPMASNAFRQLITDADWGELDYLIIDLPPGTSDIHLTLVQTLAVTGAIIVSTPQSVALADVVKGINMFRNKNINVPVLGLVENMAWFTPEEFPDNKYYIFGKEGCKQLAKEFDLPLLGQIAIVQSICEKSDQGEPAALGNNIIGEAFALLADNALEQIELRNNEHAPSNKVIINK